MWFPSNKCKYIFHMFIDAPWVIWINMRTFSEFSFEFLCLSMPKVEWPLIFQLLYLMLNFWRNTRDWNLSHGIIKDIVIVMFWNSIFFHVVTSCQYYFTYTSLLCNKLSSTSFSVTFCAFFFVDALLVVPPCKVLDDFFFLKENVSFLPCFTSLYIKVKCVYQTQPFQWSRFVHLEELYLI